MAKIVRDGQVVEDEWRLVEEEVDGDVAPMTIISLTSWLAYRELDVDLPIGVWLQSDEAAEELANYVSRLQVIALHFPQFTDGRHFTTAHLLRTRYKYEGEIRAFGDVRRDQVEQMHRCGFNAYAPGEEQTAEGLLAGLSLFSHGYQTSSDRPDPLYRLREQ